LSTVIGAKQEVRLLEKLSDATGEFQKYLYLLLYEPEYHNDVIFRCSAMLHKNVNLKNGNV